MKLEWYGYMLKLHGMFVFLGRELSEAGHSCRGSGIRACLIRKQGCELQYYSEC